MTDERQNLPSASGYYRLHACPGSWNLERELPEPPPTEDAESGTRIHAALSRSGATVEIDLTDDENQVMVECDQLAFDLATKHGFNQFSFLTEQRLWLKDETTDEPLFSGKYDRAYLLGERACLVDFKSGFTGATSAESNLQLRALAVLFWKDIAAVKEIVCAIVQPRAFPKVTVVSYDIPDLLRSEKELRNALKAARKPKAARRPGDHCKYCRGLTVCPEAHSVALTLPKSLPTSIQSLSGAILSESLGKLELVRQICDALQNEAERRLEADPSCVPGWKLKPGAPREKVTEVVAVWHRVAKLGADATEFAGACSLTKKSLTELLKLKTGQKGMALVATLKDVLDGCTESKPTAPHLERI